MNFNKMRPCGGIGNCIKCNVCSDYSDHEALKLSIEATDEDIKPFKDCDKNKTGVAIDIGTTTVVAAFYELSTGKLIKTSSMINPQTKLSTDVMGRISADINGYGNKLRAMIISCLETLTLNEAFDFCIITGNTAMLYLLTGRYTKALGLAPFEADCLFGNFEILTPDFKAYLPRCFGAFVGADISCAVLYSEMYKENTTSLLIDVGTNGEIVLNKDGRLYVTSTAAGPAFEKRGVKGSDIIDTIAEGLRLDLIDETGAIVGDEGEIKIKDIILTQRDIRNIQLSKAAISAGIKTLLKLTETDNNEIKNFYIAGSFGKRLNLENASKIGLFPGELIKKAIVYGNASLKGAARLLTEPELIKEIESFTKEAKVINLGGNAFFNELYLKEMEF